MKEYTIILGKDEIDILVDYLNSGELDSPTIEDAILRGILHQIQDQTKTEQNPPEDPDEPRWIGDHEKP